MDIWSSLVCVNKRKDEPGTENAESLHDSDEFQITKSAKEFKDVTLQDENVCSVHTFSGALPLPRLETGEEPKSATTSRELAHY